MCDTLIGDWKLVNSENFEELMKELGVGLVMRKLGSTTKPNVKFSKNGDEWTFTTTSTLKTHTIKFKLNEQFDEETLDGRKVKTIMSLDGNKLVQTQRDKDNNITCVITREITDNGELKTVRIQLFFSTLPSSIYLFIYIFFFYRLLRLVTLSRLVLITKITKLDWTGFVFFFYFIIVLVD